jgi:hypothetical protein
MNAEATAVRDTKAIGTAIPGRWSTPPSDAAFRAVVRLGLIPLHLLGTRIGRRLMATAVLSLILVGAVSALYDHADSPASAPRPLDTAVRAAASKPVAGGNAGTAGGAARSAGGSHVTSLASVAAARPAKDARSAAVAWYASRVHVSPDRVQALQQQRVNGTTTKVLVMAQVSETNVPTAFVTVRRAGGGWKVS